jgi:hypothetical protein
MNKKRISLVFTAVFVALSVFAQDNRERVYVHLNTQTLVAGESLLLSAYCRSQLTGQSANLSKVLYVEIIGSSGPIFQEKIRLENGRGSSEFFISSLVPTGKYQLVAYTRWMKNFDEYFKSSLNIINPFEPWPETVELESQLEVAFFIDNKRPIVGIENSIGFKINTNTTSASLYSGKVVNGSGETLTTITMDSFGLGTFTFSPQLGESYSLILEDDQGKINFFKIPDAVENGTNLQLGFNGDLLIVNLQTEGQEKSLGTLFLYNENRKIAELLVDLNSRTSIDLSDTKGELFIAEVLDDNNITIATKRILKPYTKNQSAEIQLETAYPLRSEVNLGISLAAGTYSLSVRKKDNYIDRYHNTSLNSGWLPLIKNSPVELDEYFSGALEPNLEAFMQGAELKPLSYADDIKFMPDFRNEFLDGRVLNNDQSPKPGEVVALTTFSDPFLIQTAKSDINGNFSIPFASLSRNTDAIVTPVSLDSTLSIVLNSPFVENYEDFNFNLSTLDSAQVREVIDKSIRIQIANAYYKPIDSVMPIGQSVEQFSFNKSYVLDDYTRFNSLQETFLEYIPEASVRTNRNPRIKPHFKSVPEQIKRAPLLLLDGVPVSADRILEFSASNIERIDILHNRYFLGTLASDGVISFKTFEGKMGRYTRGSYHHSTTILGLQEAPPLKTPRHDTNNNSRLPDQRDQLYWHPKVEFNEFVRQDLTFYTSDVTGTFELIVEGFQNDGTPVSIRKSFIVNELRP